MDTNVCKEFETCIGGYARTIAVVKRLLRTRSNPIYLNAGDTYTGTIWYSIDRWNVTSYFLNLLKADVMVSEFCDCIIVRELIQIFNID